MAFTKGHKSGMTGKKHSSETKVKIGASNSTALKQFYLNGGSPANKGIARPELAERYKGEGNPMFGKPAWNRGLKGFLGGDKHPNWQGGISPEHSRIRESLDYQKWRTNVFERDGYKCVWCKDARGGNLQADHIKPFAWFPDLRLALTNGQTLCESCHDWKTGIDNSIFQAKNLPELNIIFT